jgi:hypothetical protein
MRRVFSGLAAVVLVCTMVAPTFAAADVSGGQYRTYGAEAWLTNAREDSPPGFYYDLYVQAFRSNDPTHSTSYDWVYVGYQGWERKHNGDWVPLAGADGYARNGAEGLELSVGDLASATVTASVPVGWCRSYEPEDAGGDCIDYVDVGTAVVDLAWTPTSGLLSWTRGEQMVSPAAWVSTWRRTSHYREATLTGEIVLPELGTFEVTAQDGDGYITRWRIGSSDLYVMRGRPSVAPPFVPPFSG